MSEKMTIKPTAFYANNGAYKLTSYYGWRKDPFTGEEKFHPGIDLVGQDSKDIIAIASGTVIRSRIVDKATDTTSTWQWGNYIAIQQENGHVSYYCHLSERFVEAGQKVSKGDIIGKEGSTGRSTGSHLHFELRNSSNQDIDPTTVDYLNIAYQADVIVVPDEEIEYEYRKDGYDPDLKDIISTNNNQDSYYQDNDDFAIDTTDGYEPIYPDLTRPPVLSTKTLETNLNIRDIDSLSSVIKENTGGIINYYDPYPIDKKIMQLEQHLPRVKRIVSANSSCSAKSCTCPSGIAKLANTINALSEAVEKRIVQLENISSANFRILHRLSSRINVNCVYYGGQSVFDKYLCIRCLHDDMINDTSISLDQCLNCTRYEPIIGQVYELDDE